MFTEFEDTIEYKGKKYPDWVGDHIVIRLIEEDETKDTYLTAQCLDRKNKWIFEDFDITTIEYVRALLGLAVSDARSIIKSLIFQLEGASDALCEAIIGAYLDVEEKQYETNQPISENKITLEGNEFLGCGYHRACFIINENGDEYYAWVLSRLCDEPDPMMDMKTAKKYNVRLLGDSAEELIASEVKDGEK